MKLLKEYDFTKMSVLPYDWNIEIGEKWANNEIQQYVDSKENIFFNQGLHLQATYDEKVVKSARINTKHNFKFTYGFIEVVAKIPKGKGTWPAIWMMPEQPMYGHWPKSGEIDIMEHTAKDMDKLFFCLHTEKYNHRNPKEQYYNAGLFPGITDDFHTFSLLWEQHKMTYFVDDKIVATYEKGEDGKDTSHAGWPFDYDYYLILNLAIGGMFGGEVDYTSFPQSFIIKSVRVYQ
jgi:beta-glucanase (GH16 family)